MRGERGARAAHRTLTVVLPMPPQRLTFPALGRLPHFPTLCRALRPIIPDDVSLSANGGAS